MKKWEKDLAGCYRDIASMKERLGIADEEAARLEEIAVRYPVCVPEYYLSLIDPSDPDDPIRKMAVPGSVEFSEGGSKDTSGEYDNTVIRFKRTTNKDISKFSYKTALTVQALKALGKDKVDEPVIEKLRKLLSSEEKATMLNEAKIATSWIYEYIKQICRGEK